MFTIFIAFSMTVRCLELCRVIDNGNKEGEYKSEIPEKREGKRLYVVVVVIVIFLCNVIFAAVVVVVVVVLIIVVFVFVVIVIFIVIVIIIVKSPSLTSTN